MSRTTRSRASVSIAQQTSVLKISGCKCAARALQHTRVSTRPCFNHHFVAPHVDHTASNQRFCHADTNAAQENVLGSPNAPTLSVVVRTHSPSEWNEIHMASKTMPPPPPPSSRTDTPLESYVILLKYLYLRKTCVHIFALTVSPHAMRLSSHGRAVSVAATPLIIHSISQKEPRCVNSPSPKDNKDGASYDRHVE
jgi:hypothetical protein